MMTVRYFVVLAVAFIFYSGNIWILNQVVELPFYMLLFYCSVFEFIFLIIFCIRDMYLKINSIKERS